jgi:drug/metabolite transporter (DMT)-like permease
VSRANLGRLALLALLWGSSFLWIKIGLRGFSPVQLTFARLALGCAVLVPVALARGLRFPTGRSVWVHLMVAALFANAIPYTLFGVAERTVGSNVAGVLNATTPLWTVLVALAAGTDRDITVRRGIGLALGFAGTILIFSPWRSASEIASWGGLACLDASASYGVSYVYMGRYLTNRGIPPLILSASQLAAAAVLLAITLPVGWQSPQWRFDAVGAVLILGVFGTGLAYVLNYRLIADEGPTAASTTTYLLPIVAVALGAVVLDEAVTWPMIVGMILVLAGVGLAQRRAATPGRAVADSKRFGAPTGPPEPPSPA